MAGSVRDPPPPSLDRRQPQLQVPSSRGGGRGTPPSPSSGGGGSGSGPSVTSHILRTPPAAAHAKATHRASTPSTLGSTPGGEAAAAQSSLHRKEEHGKVAVDLQVRIVTSGSSISVADGGGGGGGRHGTSVLDGTDGSNGGGGDESRLVHQLLEVKFDDLVRREEEMWHVARTFAVPPGRWNGSRMYQCYQHEMKERAERSKYHAGDNQDQQPKPLVLFLDPTAFCCREQHLSSVFRWKPWLGEMMQSYLRTGVLTVNKDATGDDWLLCCEFFSVLYQPSQVVFETLHAYQNVSAWSDYLSKRCDLAEWVADSVLRHNETVFVVTHKQDNGWSVEVDQLQKPAASFVDEKADLALTDFFHDDDHPVDRETRQVRMRADFCGYLEHVMSHVHCRFDMELVTMTNQVQRFAPRAVLRVRTLLNPPLPPISQPKKTRSALPFPVDELVAEELQEGRLERLVQKVDARNPSSAPEAAPANEVRPEQPAVVRSGHTPEAKANDEPRAPNHSLAMASVKAQQTLVDGLPFSVIRTISNGEGNQSVTSALTGPFLFDEDGIMREPSEFYDAAVVAAVGSSWRSRDPAVLPSHVKALADDDTTKSHEVDTTPQKPGNTNMARSVDVLSNQVEGEPADEKKVDADDEQWDWLTNVCQYSASFLSRRTEIPSPSDTPRDASDESKLKKDHDSKRSAKLLELQTKAAESRSQKAPGGVRADTHREEIRVVSLHREFEEEKGRNHSAATAAAVVPPAYSRRIHNAEATSFRLSDSTGSLNGGRDRPEPLTKVGKQRGYESQATSTVSATLQPISSTRSHASQKRLITPKRLALKGLFRRHKAEV